VPFRHCPRQQEQHTPVASQEGQYLRTAKKKYDELKERGRSLEQIRAIAIARDDKELREYITTLSGDVHVEGKRVKHVESKVVPS
jgi:hypothetical protein